MASSPTPPGTSRRRRGTLDPSKIDEIAVGVPMTWYAALNDPLPPMPTPATLERVRRAMAASGELGLDVAAASSTTDHPRLAARNGAASPNTPHNTFGATASLNVPPVAYQRSRSPSVDCLKDTVQPTAVYHEDTFGVMANSHEGSQSPGAGTLASSNEDLNGVISEMPPGVVVTAGDYVAFAETIGGDSNTGEPRGPSTGGSSRASPAPSTSSAQPSPGRMVTRAPHRPSPRTTLVTLLDAEDDEPDLTTMPQTTTKASSPGGGIRVSNSPKADTTAAKEWAGPSAPPSLPPPSGPSDRRGTNGQGDGRKGAVPATRTKDDDSGDSPLLPRIERGFGSDVMVGGSTSSQPAASFDAAEDIGCDRTTASNNTPPVEHRFTGKERSIGRFSTDPASRSPRKDPDAEAAKQRGVLGDDGTDHGSAASTQRSLPSPGAVTPRHSKTPSLDATNGAPLVEPVHVFGDTVGASTTASSSPAHSPRVLNGSVSSETCTRTGIPRLSLDASPTASRRSANAGASAAKHDVLSRRQGTRGMLERGVRGLMVEELRARNRLKVEASTGGLLLFRELSANLESMSK